MRASERTLSDSALIAASRWFRYIHPTHPHGCGETINDRWEMKCETHEEELKWSHFYTSFPNVIGVDVFRKSKHIIDDFHLSCFMDLWDILIFFLFSLFYIISGLARKFRAYCTIFSMLRSAQIFIQFWQDLYFKRNVKIVSFYLTLF